MSISPLNNFNQTGLVPQKVLGYSNDGVSAIQILPTEITLGSNLNTQTPIYVGISASTGLTTTRPLGLNINCSLDMNSNNITKLGNQKFSDIINISDLTTSVEILSNNLGNLNLQSSNQLTLTGTNGINLITTSPGIINISNPIKFSGEINIRNHSTTAEIFSISNLGKLTLQCSNHLLLNVNNNSKIELSPGLLTINGSGANGILINSISNINITAATQINLSTTSMNFSNGISINDINNNSIIGTSLTGLTLNSNTSITLNAPTISIPNLIIPSNITLSSLTYSSGINIQDNIYHTSITSYNNISNNSSTMDINVNNAFIYTQLNLLAYNIVTPANLIFQNGIKIMDSLSQSNPNITGNGSALTFNSQNITLNSQVTYVSNIESTTGTLSLTSRSATPSILNLITNVEGTINLTASQTIMSGSTSSKYLILNNQTGFPNNPISGTICNNNNKLYFYDGTLWKEIAFV
jgi:hypothetical protein